MIRKHFLFALQALVTIALLALLFRGFDWQAFRRLLHGIPWWFYAFSFTTILAGQVLYAWRWHLILVALAVPVSFSVVLRQFLVGVFFNNFLPSTMGGDSVKVYYLGRAEGYVRVTASVLADRGIGVLLVATLAVTFARYVDDAAPALVAAKAVVMLTWLGLAAVLLVATFAPPGMWLRDFAGRWPWLKANTDRATRFVGHIQTVMRQPRVLFGAGLVVGAYFVLLGLVYQQFITLATGVRPAMFPVIGVVAIIATLSNVPVAVNGLGLREHLHLALLGAFGLTPEAAVGISLLLFAHVLAISVGGAVVWMRTPVDMGRDS